MFTFCGYNSCCFHMFVFWFPTVYIIFEPIKSRCFRGPQPTRPLPGSSAGSCVQWDQHVTSLRSNSMWTSIDSSVGWSAPSPHSFFPRSTRSESQQVSPPTRKLRPAGLPPHNHTRVFRNTQHWKSWPFGISECLKLQAWTPSHSVDCRLRSQSSPTFNMSFNWFNCRRLARAKGQTW